MWSIKKILLLILKLLFKELGNIFLVKIKLNLKLANDFLTLLWWDISSMRISIVLVIILIMACSREDGSKTQAPPIASVQQKILQNHGYNRIDEYYWIRDDLRQNETVIELLELENAYTDAVMKHTTALQKSLVEELSSRLPSAKKSVPIQHDQYLYFQIADGS